MQNVKFEISLPTLRSELKYFINFREKIDLKLFGINKL